MNWETVAFWGAKVVGVFALFYVGLWAAKFARKLIEKVMTRAGIDATLIQFAGNAARWAIVVLVSLTCLETFGIETTGFAALIGAGALAIGLAFQGTLSSIAAGVLLLVLRPFKVGDFIKVAGTQGFVVEIGLFAILLDTKDHRRIVVPNSSVIGTVIENLTHHEKRRVDVSVGTDYSADLKQTRAVLEAVVAAHTPEGFEGAVVLTGLGACSIDWQLRIWAPTEDYFSVLEAVTVDIKTQLDDAKIGIPFPQMDVHVNQLAA